MRVTERIVASFLLFAALLAWPILSIANRPALVLGMPALALYLFVVWGAIVVVLWRLDRQARGPEDAA